MADTINFAQAMLAKKEKLPFLDFTKPKKCFLRDVVSHSLLLPVRLRRLRLVVHPHLPPQVVAGHLALLQVLDHRLTSFLRAVGRFFIPFGTKNHW